MGGPLVGPPISTGGGPPSLVKRPLPLVALTLVAGGKGQGGRGLAGPVSGPGMASPPVGAAGVEVKFHFHCDIRIHSLKHKL